MVSIGAFRIEVRTTSIEQARHSNFRLAPPREAAEYFRNQVRSLFDIVDYVTPIMNACDGLVKGHKEKCIEEIIGIVKIDPALVGQFFDEPDFGVSFAASIQVTPNIYIHKKAPKGILLNREGNNFIIIANDKKEVTSLIELIKNHLEMINKISQDFGVNLEKIVYGKDYALSIISNLPNVEKIEHTDVKNDFEVEMGKIVADFTDTYLGNANVFFNSPLENFEYDLIIPFTNDIILDIELKDYEKVKDEINPAYAEGLKQNIVLKILDKGKRLNAISVVVVKNFPEVTYGQLKELATSRGLILMNADEFSTSFESFFVKLILNKLKEISYTQPWDRETFEVL